jgi:DNA-directed RNA polymerase specialized sigma24 family protein
MKYSIEFKGFERGSERARGLRKLVEQYARQLNKSLKDFSPDEIFLTVMLEQNATHKLDRVSLSLKLPGKTLTATEERREDAAVKVALEEIVRTAFREIEDQVEEYRLNRRGELDLKGIAPGEDPQIQKIGAVATQWSDGQAFFSFVKSHLNELIDFARHMVSYAEASGDLLPGELKPQDLVDSTLVEAHREFVKDPARGDPGRWLINVAGRQLDAAVIRSKLERRRTVPFEQSVPETPPAEELAVLSDEVYDFYKPEEALTLEEVFPDLSIPAPEEKIERERLQECVRAALKNMPARWLRELMLRHVISPAPSDEAKPKGDSLEADRMVEYAKEFLRHKLLASGCIFEANKGKTSAK